jgi:membrane-bound metal-dependent hydrolase YbcI (DUF457 family)
LPAGVFIAHLPAGYLVTRAIARRRPTAAELALGLFGSIAPDLDLLYFYTIDRQQQLHHSYWTHTPFYWLLIALALGSLALYRPVRRRATDVLKYLLPGVLLHLILDSVAAEIRWLYPLCLSGYGLVEVPARYSNWILNFVLHWSFALELMLVAAAAGVLLADRYGLGHGDPPPG